MVKQCEFQINDQDRKVENNRNELLLWVAFPEAFIT